MILLTTMHRNTHYGICQFFLNSVYKHVRHQNNLSGIHDLLMVLYRTQCATSCTVKKLTPIFVPPCTYALCTKLEQILQLHTMFSRKCNISHEAFNTSYRVLLKHTATKNANPKKEFIITTIFTIIFYAMTSHFSHKILLTYLRMTSTACKVQNATNNKNLNVATVLSFSCTLQQSQLKQNG